MLLKKFIIIQLVLFVCCKSAHAQLWKYIGDTPAKEKAFEKYLQKEAFSVVAHHTADEDKFPYDELIYHLQSLNTSVVDVHIFQIPFTKTLTITTLTDSLKIHDCVGAGRIHLLSKNMLEIVYSPRGGSDDGYDNVLLLAIRDGKFRIAMDIESMHDYDTPTDFGLYEAHLIFKEQKPQNYQLTIKTHNLLTSRKKSKNSSHYHIYPLKYNDSLNIFYTRNELINSKLLSIGTDTKDQRIKGVFPVIILDTAEYCYINERWYSVGSDWNTKEMVMVNYCYRPALKK